MCFDTFSFSGVGEIPLLFFYRPIAYSRDNETGHLVGCSETYWTVLIIPKGALREWLFTIVKVSGRGILYSGNATERKRPSLGA